MSVLKCIFIKIFQIYTHNPIENLGRIERVGKVAIIKQQIESICIAEALPEKMQKLQAGNHLQQDVYF
jgi:hypothetical protein